MPIYMKYEGIEGSATGKYKGWIDLESCQLNPYVRSGRVGASEIVVTKSHDTASPQLFKEGLTGTGKKVTVDFVKGNIAPYMSIEMEGVLISSYSVGGSGASQDKSSESLSLNYTKISYSTKETADSKDPKDAKDKLMWDIATK